MASRLSHELRTPIAVVRSSLDNLKLAPLPEDARVYIERAQGGLNRLAHILTRMTEATRLEQSLHDADRERFELAQVVAGCVAGYRIAYPQRAIELTLPGAAVWCDGAPELIAQMLDKLFANAIEFGTPDTPVVIRRRSRCGAGHADRRQCGAAAADRNGRPAVRLDGLGAIGTRRRRAASRARTLHRPADRGISRRQGHSRESRRCIGCRRHGYVALRCAGLSANAAMPAQFGDNARRRSSPSTIMPASFLQHPALVAAVLLTGSNLFMTFAWYGHLKNLHDRAWWVAALYWGIALFEYLLQVPANRIGYTTMSLGQLKIMQEVITLTVFVPFAVFYMGSR